MTDDVFISVVIPVYNREQFVFRAIASALADDGGDFEIIVVDDGSVDQTVAAVASIVDPRVELIRHGTNRGRCAARNTGAAAARGEWVVFLDSDDELVAGGLSMIRARAQSASPQIGKLLFMCRDDTGAVSPRPRFGGEIVDYVGYLRWLEQASRGSTEALACVRRCHFAACPYPTGRFWSEGIHELDFARLHSLRLCPDIVRFYHHDAVNRLVVPGLDDLLAQAPDFAAYAAAVFERHGGALRRHALSAWIINARQAALFHFLNRDRSRGVWHSLRVLRWQPVNVRVWIVLFAGLLGPYPLAKLKTFGRSRATT